MTRPQKRALIIGLAVVAAGWLAAWSGFAYARNSRMTAEKLNVYLREVEFSKLDGAARDRALRDLIRKVNALDAEERRQMRRHGELARVFTGMSDAEKAEYIDATMPRQFQQMLTAFEKLPEEKRKKAIDDAARRLRQQAAEDGVAASTNAAPVLTEDLQKRIVRAGLKTYYSESSSQTKAELTPFLEELQRTMQRGHVFRGR